MLKDVGLSAKRLSDMVAPILFLGYAIGRIGCQLSGDGDWGIPSNMALKPSWIPDWLWGSYYTNNVLGVHLEQPVYPTPLYETLACFFLFLILWSLRKHKFQPGWLFSLYLFFAGVERLLIEQIRVNVKYDFGFIQATQAEIVSVLLIFAGLFGVIKFMGQKEFLPETLSPLKKVSQKGKKNKNKEKNKKKTKAKK